MHNVSLAEAPLAVPLTLAAVPPELAIRLRRLGLRRGALLTVLKRSTGGGRVICIAGSRVALGAALLPRLSAEVA